MSGLFGTFNSAVKGLHANQTAVHTASHNISNANTEGFSRQRVDMKASTPYDFEGVGQLGTGVTMTGIERMVDEFVDYQIRNENSTLSQYEAKHDVMTQIEMVFNEPSETGINHAMGQMFDSWQELSKNPESLNAQSIVVEQSKSFSDAVNHMSKQIQELKADTVDNVEKNVFDVNALVGQLNTVNDQIFNISVKGHTPNDLLDQRDVILKELSSLTETKESFDKWGRAEVTIDGTVVSGKEVEETLSAVHSITDNGDGTYNLTIAKGGDLTDLEERNNVEEADVDGLKAGDAVFYNETTGDYAKADVKEGKIGGHQEALAEIDARVTDLDTFARGVATLVNTVHRDATENTSDGSPGIDFFTFGGGGETALNFQINQAIRADESLVATGADESAAPGDGSGALAIANLRNTEVRFDEIGSITYDSSTMTVENQDGGVTMEGKYRDMVIKVGISTQHADNMVDNQEALMAQLSNRRESVSGVSIDEEVTNLIKFQQSYNANSRVISTVSEMLDTLINRTGL